MITEFKNNYSFLSNFFPCKVTYNGISYKNNEAAFQAQKCPERALEFVNLTPTQAKRLGRQVELRPDWEEVKDTIMYEICRCKFIDNPMMKFLLARTEEHLLVESNWWNDTYWGVCRGVGENKLGKILMQIRDEIKEHR